MRKCNNPSTGSGTALRWFDDAHQPALRLHSMTGKLEIGGAGVAAKSVSKAGFDVFCETKVKNTARGSRF